MREPSIIVAARAWRIPFLAPRQNRIVVPALVRLGAIPAQRYEDLLDIVFAALTRAHPSLDRDEFEELPVPTYELLDALPIISAQTGIMKPAKGKRGSDELPDWDAIIAQFCNFLPGTTPDYWEDALTWPRFEAMKEEWRKHPPMAVLYAGRHGYKPPRPEPEPSSEEAILQFLRLFPTGEMRMN